MTHSYLKSESGFAGIPKINATLPASEVAHMKMLNDMSRKVSHEIFKKTPAEHDALKAATRNYPNKNHRPLTK